MFLARTLLPGSPNQVRNTDGNACFARLRRGRREAKSLLWREGPVSMSNADGEKDGGGWTRVWAWLLQTAVTVENGDKAAARESQPSDD